jgi:hypothetical protein
MDPLVEAEQSDCHLVNKEHLPRKSFTFRADELIGQRLPGQPISSRN